MGIAKTAYIWMDGRLVPWESATVHVGAHALHYGSSVFEGIRAYRTPRGTSVFCLDEHVKRMFNSCKLYKMPVPYSQDEIKRAITETVRVNGLGSGYIRPIVFRGFNAIGIDPRSCPVQVAVFVFEWGRYLGQEAAEQGVDVGISSWRRMAPDTFPALAKLGGNYINSQFIAMEAADSGYAEGLALDTNGYVSEGSGENIFAVLDGILYTPPVGASILKGVTRHVVMTLARDLGYGVAEQNIPREMLYIADEMFFTGTAAEITPIRSLDRVPIGAGKRGPITARLQEEFFAIVEGRQEDRHHWLTPASEDVQSTLIGQDAAVPAE